MLHKFSTERKCSKQKTNLTDFNLVKSSTRIISINACHGETVLTKIIIYWTSYWSPQVMV